MATETIRAETDDAPFGHTELDAANQSLADALRKSFRILKLLMLVLVGLYFLSGWFSVKQGERGLVLRFGRIVGTGENEETRQAVLAEGWHWSWPFPIDRWITVPVNERELRLKFMLKLLQEERATGKIKKKFTPLSPARDDYLVTGDANILHASLKLKYRISNVIDYITNVYPMSDPRVDALTALNEPYRKYAEYTVLRNLARDAVIETAAGQAALDIRGSKQDLFLLAVADNLKKKLDHLADQGVPLGIELDVNSAVIAPKAKTGGLDAIIPPLQTLEVFDAVFGAQTRKSITIREAQAGADVLKSVTAGPNHERIAEAIDNEFALIIQLSAAEANPDGDASAADIEAMRAALADQKEITELLLTDATGKVRSILKNALIRRDRILKEAGGDHSRFASVLPEYQSNPGLFLSRLRDEAMARAFSSAGVAKIYVPQGATQYRLHIPRNRKKFAFEKKKEAEEAAAEPSPFSVEHISTGLEIE